MGKASVGFFLEWATVVDETDGKVGGSLNAGKRRGVLACPRLWLDTLCPYEGIGRIGLREGPETFFFSPPPPPKTNPNNNNSSAGVNESGGKSAAGLSSDRRASGRAGEQVGGGEADLGNCEEALFSALARL